MLHEAFKPETETEALTHETEARPRRGVGTPRDRGVETEATTLSAGGTSGGGRVHHPLDITYSRPVDVDRT